MHPFHSNSVVLNILFWATRILCYFLALYFAFNGAGNLVWATGHVFHFAFKSFQKYSFGFFLVAVYCFAMAAAFYYFTTPQFLNMIAPYFFKNVIVTVAVEAVCVLLPINLMNTFTFEATQHQRRINNPEGAE